jgi:hypothetical protein
VLDECFNVRDVEIASAAPCLKTGFLKTMAKVFADHQDFWIGSALDVSSDLRIKLKQFPIHQPGIAHLCGASGQGQTQLYLQIVMHLDSGKRSRRLTKFDIPEYMGANEDAAPGQCPCRRCER